MRIQPFTIHIQEEILRDLKERLGRTRWPDELADAGWDYGTNLTYLKELVRYWQTSFDWRAQERMLNAFPHFKAEVQGLSVHFIHQRGKGPNPLPLIITHGWPSTFFEMHKIIKPLADPAAHGGDTTDAFDVVVPSVPGYGFSERPKTQGMDPARIADLWVELMEGLGYKKFAAQGGDWGAVVTARMGYAHPHRLTGIHLNMVPILASMGPVGRPLSEAERAYLEDRERWRLAEGAYAAIQGTKPQSLGYALNDSPAGLAGWIVEKFRTWTDCGGNIESRVTKDELLTNLTIYWATQTIVSSTRLYYERVHHPWSLEPGKKVTVPTGVAVFPKELSRPPRELVERDYNLQRWTVMPSGGHFAALEEPQRLVEDIRAFFRTLRK